MSKYSTTNIPLQRERFLKAWREFAGDESFAGMNLAEFEAATAPSVSIRDELDQLRARQRGVLAQRRQTDKLSREMMQRVVNAVRASAGHGADSAMYRAIGYVPQSERGSGLTRKTSLPGVGTAPAMDVV